MTSYGPVTLSAAPVVDGAAGQPWSPGGPICVYDGDGPAASLPKLGFGCPRCGAAQQLGLGELLRAPRLPARPAQPWVDAVVAAFGLTRRGSGDFQAIVDPLGLPACLLVWPCRACAADIASLWGYGEFQPGREVATFLGAAPCTAP